MRKLFELLLIALVFAVAVALVYSLLLGIAHTRKLGMDYCLTKYTPEECYLYAE